MDDKLAYQLCEHTYGATKWLLQYIRNHNLAFTKEDHHSILEFHLNRIDALFNEIEHPLTVNPILSDAGYHQEKQHASDDKETEPLILGCGKLTIFLPDGCEVGYADVIRNHKSYPIH